MLALDVVDYSTLSTEKHSVSVRGALLTKGPDSSFAEAHRGLAPNRSTLKMK